MIAAEYRRDGGIQIFKEKPENALFTLNRYNSVKKNRSVIIKKAF